MGLRQLTVGPISGLSSYELAIKFGLFTGTEAEYAQKEQKVYNDMVEYTKSAQNQIYESIEGLGLNSNGSWFVKNNISSLNSVIDNVRTIMGNEVTEGLPPTLTVGSTLTFECNTVYDENNKPIFSRQIIVELTPDNDINVYNRAQVIKDGLVTVDGWSVWELVNRNNNAVGIYSGTPIVGNIQNMHLNLEVAQLRNIIISETPLIAGESKLAHGTIYLVVKKK